MRHLVRGGELFFLAGGLAFVLVGPYLVPVPPLKGTYPAHDLADEDSDFIVINNLDIHVKKKGQGEPVFLLLHGFAASLYSWNMVMEPLSQLGTAIAFDRPGFGLSEHPIRWAGKNPYSPENQVDIVTRLLDYYGVNQAILVGNSAGGTISMQVALNHPERVSALILVDAAVYRSGPPDWLHTWLATPQMRHLGPLIARQILKRGPELIRLAWHNPELLSSEMLEYYQKPFRVENWDKALWEYTLASKRARPSKRLKEITQPVLVITGDDDRIVPTSDSIRLARELPNANLKVIANAGHIPHEEQPGVFMDAVASFINKHLARN